MKKVFLAFLIMTSCNLHRHPSEIQLFPVIHDGLWGYIDLDGQSIIAPRFLNVGRFSKGLAPARLQGSFGYIDTKGDFVIQPQYDFAESFKGDFAKVYIESKPYFINREGTKIFEHNFVEMDESGASGLFLAEGQQHGLGLVDYHGKLLLDTIYKDIQLFSEGLAIVTGPNDETQADDDGDFVYEVGVINTSGKFIVPFGVYESIRSFKGNLAQVIMKSAPANNHYSQGFINKNGELAFAMPKGLSFLQSEFSEDALSIDVELVDQDTFDYWPPPIRYKYSGMVNTRGELLFSNFAWDEMTSLHNNRAFVRDTLSNWHLIDRTGKQVGDEIYADLVYGTYIGSDPSSLFRGGVEFVKTKTDEWAIIDTLGTIVHSFDTKKIDILEPYRSGNFILYSSSIPITDSTSQYRYGFINLENGSIVEPKFEHIDVSGFDNDLIPVIVDGEDGYIDHQGNVIWKHEISSSSTKKLNIDYMNRGYFYASSPIQDEYGGHYYNSPHNYKKIEPSQDFEMDQLSVGVVANDTAVYRKMFKGMVLYVANTTNKTYYFDVQDDRLYLKIQAKDAKGQWRDIEYLPRSWCGNSYYTNNLAGNSYWSFVIPQYDGDFKTVLRAELQYKTTGKSRDKIFMYSNEFEGSINPGQFWREQSYSPIGIMDPYFN